MLYLLATHPFYLDASMGSLPLPSTYEPRFPAGLLFLDDEILFLRGIFLYFFIKIFNQQAYLSFFCYLAELNEKII